AISELYLKLTSTVSPKLQFLHWNVRSSTPKLTGSMRAMDIADPHCGHGGRKSVFWDAGLTGDWGMHSSCYRRESGRVSQSPKPGGVAPVGDVSILTLLRCTSVQ